MSPPDKTLVRKLAVVLALKLLVLSMFWWAFVREERVPVHSEGVAERVLGTPAPAATNEHKE